ncbi:hypothetical protein [Prochlorococcus sp. MIT 1303]|nr:hypothetical protein [Prochlorococcus sp. MIT 1303]KZR64512.1 hypothetical protein PMIT1303_01557 [Prochlorococcus sp. MIT 1303]
MDAKTFQERAERFAPAVTGEKAPTYDGLKPGNDGYLVETLYEELPC